MIPTEKIAILDYSTGEVRICTISQREEAEDFFTRKGLRTTDIAWMRGDLQIYVENEPDN